MSEIEAQVETYLISTIVKLGGMCLKFGVPGVRGYPDRLCILPGGRMFFVELKRPKNGRVAKLQVERRSELEAQGVTVYLAKNRGEVDAIIQRELDRVN
jgi:hypothetical protein